MKHSLKDHSGYLIIDHRDSPGINREDIPKSIQDSTIVVNKGQVYEADIQQCSHCQRGVVLNPDRIRARAYCPHCHHYICDSCRTALDISGNCVPFRKIFDRLIV